MRHHSVDEGVSPHYAWLSQSSIGTYHDRMSFIAGAHAAVGPYGYSQEEIIEAFTAVVSPEGAH